MLTMLGASLLWHCVFIQQKMDVKFPLRCKEKCSWIKTLVHRPTFAQTTEQASVLTDTHPVPPLPLILTLILSAAEQDELLRGASFLHGPGDHHRCSRCAAAEQQCHGWEMRPTNTVSCTHTCTALHRVRRQTFHTHTHVHMIPLNYMCSEHLCINEWRPFPCFEPMSFDRMCYIRATQCIEQFLLISNFCVMFSHNEDTFLRIQNCFKSNIFQKALFHKEDCTVLYWLLPP